MDRTKDLLTEENLRAHLSRGSPVSRVICLDTVDSTNTRAKTLALEGAEDGTLVVAERQTGGRGRFGHSFLSPSGTGLYMTLILRPEMDLERFQRITVAAAAAVCLVLEERTSLCPWIKWVNDILILRDDRFLKVCGILAETVSGPGGTAVVVGIGVNLTTRDFGGLEGVGALFPDAEGPIPGRAELAAAIAERLMGFSRDLEDPGLIAIYRARSLLPGREITYIQDGRRRLGRALEVDDQGSLVVRSLDGDEGVIALRSGEVWEVRLHA